MRNYRRLLAGLAILATALGLAAADAADSENLFGHNAFERLRAVAGQRAQAQTPPSLQQRRRNARQTKIRHAAAHCRLVSQQLAALKARPCAQGDRLDPMTNLCHARKNVWMPYIRWDPAAGRCKPRDSFDGASCVGSKRHYKPGKRYAHSPAHSARMYGNATSQLEDKLKECRHMANSLKRSASTERAKNNRNCHKARKLKRADLVKFYCK